MKNLNDQSQIERARQNFIKTGEIDKCVPEDIAASWKKSAEFGVDASSKVLPGKLNRDVLTNVIVQLNTRDSYFYDAEAEMLDYLGAAIVFVDDHLDVFAIRGSRELKDELRAKNFRFGSNLAESRVGTNALTLAFESGQDKWVYGSEHYLDALKDYVCVATCPQFSNSDRVGIVFPCMIIVPTERFFEGMDAIFSYILKTHMYRQNSVLNSNYLMYNAVINFFIAQSGMCYIAVDNSNTIIDVSDNVLTCQNIKLNQIIGLKLENLSPSLAEVAEKDANAEAPTQVHRVMLKVGPYYVKKKDVLSAGEIIGAVMFLSRDPNLLAQKLKLLDHLTDTDVPDRRTTSAKSSAYVAKYSFDNLVGFSKTFTSAVYKAQRVAQSSSSVLILGESGTGKELFAQAIHNASARFAGPFVPINCGEYTRETVETVLIGTEKSPGKFVQADGGTLFLDDISEMSQDMQSFLLRFLEDGIVTPQGSRRSIRTDVRVIAAAGSEILKRVRDGSFRLDLYYRLNVLRIDLPPLRERRADMQELSNYFVTLLSASYGKNIFSVSPETVERFKEYNWPGNLRQLRNIIERSLLKAEDGCELTITELGEDFGDAAAVEPVAASGAPFDVRDAEANRLIEALIKFNGNKAKTARYLGMSRGTLYNRLRELEDKGISF